MIRLYLTLYALPEVQRPMPQSVCAHTLGRARVNSTDTAQNLTGQLASVERLRARDVLPSKMQAGIVGRLQDARKPAAFTATPCTKVFGTEIGRET